MNNQLKLTPEQLHQLRGLRADEAVAVAQAEAAGARAESAALRVQLVRASLAAFMTKAGVPAGSKVDIEKGVVQLPRIPEPNTGKEATQEAQALPADSDGAV